MMSVSGKYELTNNIQRTKMVGINCNLSAQVIVTAYITFALYTVLFLTDQPIRVISYATSGYSYSLRCGERRLSQLRSGEIQDKASLTQQRSLLPNWLQRSTWSRIRRVLLNTTPLPVMRGATTHPM